jgi:4-hydroxy-tetrahydrodipicolinate reductase
VKILLQGAAGRMGRAVTELAREMNFFTIPIGRDGTVQGGDVVIDFSSSDGLLSALSIALDRSIPFLSGTTALADEAHRRMEEASRKIPVVWSSNFSFAFAIFRRCIAEVARQLAPDFDVEIIECHHRNKKDAPSGSTRLILEAAAHVFEGGGGDIFHGRHCIDRARGKEIGIHSIRGGGVGGGRHEVLFLGNHEQLRIAHESSNRHAYAQGALEIARQLTGGTHVPRLYGVEDFLGHVS